MYEEAAERLWEKLAAYADQIEKDVYHAVKKLNPLEGMTKTFPYVHELIAEVEEEFGIEMDLDAINWAVTRTIRGDMEKYNRLHNKHLSARR